MLPNGPNIAGNNIVQNCDNPIYNLQTVFIFSLRSIHIYIKKVKDKKV